MAVTLDPAPPLPITLGMRMWLKRALPPTRGRQRYRSTASSRMCKRNTATRRISGDLFADGIFGLAYDGTVWRIVAGLSFETTISQEFMSNAAFPVEVRYTRREAINWIVPAGVNVAQAECLWRQAVVAAQVLQATSAAAGGGGGGYTRKKVRGLSRSGQAGRCRRGRFVWRSGHGNRGGSGGLSSFMGMVAGGGGGAGLLASIRSPARRVRRSPAPRPAAMSTFPATTVALAHQAATQLANIPATAGSAALAPGPEGGSGGTMSTGGSGPGIGYRCRRIRRRLGDWHQRCWAAPAIRRRHHQVRAPPS